ncbi:MAG TPA: nuclear transport factor 2 family protein [Mycobacteriales bacterium]|nr:nuclear transport factor 2 family protein [Mycobacteriales bacterium]
MIQRRVHEADAAAVVANAQLVLHEREARDRGWWEYERSLFHAGSTVSISWFQGTGPDFVAASHRLTAGGDRTRHRLGPPVVHPNADRALVTLPMTLISRSIVDGVEVDLAGHVRMVYRTQRQAGGWGIVGMTAVYEHDQLTAAVPGQPLTVPPAELAGLRPSYRMLAWLFGRRGIPVTPDALGDDRPDEVAAFAATSSAWLNDPERSGSHH